METTRFRSFSENPARNYKGAITLMPQCVVALIVDLPVCKLRRYKLPQSLRTIQEGLGDPVPGSPRHGWLRGVLGPFFDCEVFRS